MNCIFQLVRPDDGTRLPAVTLTRSEYARVLKDCVRDAPQLLDCYVLVLAVVDDKDTEFKLCTAPMLRVESFINLFGEADNVQDVPPAARGIGSGSLYQHAEG